jgi:hypothetical protein
MSRRSEDIVRITSGLALVLAESARNRYGSSGHDNPLL